MTRKTKRAGKSSTPKARPPPPALPVVGSQRILENRSRAILAEAVSPWLVTQWNEHDYGIDAVIEILRPRDDVRGGMLVTGRRVALQLKASEDAPGDRHASIEVHVRTVRYWLASNDPFAVVFCHVPSRTLLYRWIDDELIAELAARDAIWFTRDSVTIHISSSHILSGERLGEFDREARAVLVRRHRVLSPGTYERLSEEARDAMRAVSQAASRAGFDSVVAQLAEATERVSRATYVVVLAGRMRAGKSTLFNALIRREVSPVGRRPTTAVPVFVTAGAADAARVLFLDGKVEPIDARAEALAAYATQDENPDNQKEVRTIVVRLVSERLERGIALVDAPGLFDPSKAIRAITARTLASAHAVLFVMDVSMASSGGFAVEFNVLDELTRALDHSERVLLLLNKADTLAAADREDVRATLRRTLEAHGLWDRLVAPPAFISAGRAWEWARVGAVGESPIAELERQIWDHLLRTNSTGVIRLEAAVRSSLKAIDDALRFVALRRAGAAEAEVVEQRLEKARSDIAELTVLCANRQARALTTAASHLAAELQVLPAKLGAELREAGVAPSKEPIVIRVNELLEGAFGTVWGVAERELEQHAAEVSERVQRALDQVRLGEEPTPQPAFLTPSFVMPRLDLLPPEAVGFAAVAGVVTLFVAPAWAAAVAFGSFLYGLFLGKERQLARAIAEVEKEARSHIDGSVAGPAAELISAIRTSHMRLDRYVADRWSVFEKEVRRQLEAAGTPLSDADADRLAQLEVELLATRARLARVGEEIRWTPSPPAVAVQ